jgi:restriction system protein
VAAHRRRQRGLEDMSPAEAAPRLALIAAFLVAFGTWIQLQPAPTTPPGFPQPISSPMSGGVLTILVGLAVGGIAWFLWRRAEAQHRHFQRTGYMPSDLRRLSPTQFEEWCADRLREQSYRVSVVGGQGDHGIDLIAERDGERTAVQCKRWFGVRSIGEPQIRDLYGAMQHEGASSGIVLTTGRYSDAAVKWAQGKPIKLWGIEELIAGSPPEALKPTLLTAASTQACPSCGCELVRRVNRNTQIPFWGCAGFPACRFTRPL